MFSLLHKGRHSNVAYPNLSSVQGIQNAASSIIKILILFKFSQAACKGESTLEISLQAFAAKNGDAANKLTFNDTENLRSISFSVS